MWVSMYVMNFVWLFPLSMGGILWLLGLAKNYFTQFLIWHDMCIEFLSLHCDSWCLASWNNLNYVLDFNYICLYFFRVMWLKLCSSNNPFELLNKVFWNPNMDSTWHQAVKKWHFGCFVGVQKFIHGSSPWIMVYESIMS
jgi:hypothetical protein